MKKKLKQKKTKSKTLLTYDKLQRLNTKGYSSGFMTNFIKEESFDSILKDFHSLLPNILKNGDLTESVDPNQSVPVLSLGGGGEGNSLEKMRELFLGINSLENLLEELNTQEFCDYIFSNLDLKRHKLIQPKEKFTLRDLIFRRRPCILNCKLSAYSANSGIAYHRDNPRKLVAMLFYLGFSDYKIRSQSGTQFYSDNSSGQFFSRNSEDHIISSDYLTLVHDQLPNPNSFVSFETNNYSWHRVKKVVLDSGIYRFNFQINFQIPTYYTFPLRVIYGILKILSPNNAYKIFVKITHK